MWRDVPFARQRRPIIGVLRMCWLLPGLFDCFCCPHTSVHRPSIACLAVFLWGPRTPMFPPGRSLRPTTEDNPNSRCQELSNRQRLALHRRQLTANRRPLADGKPRSLVVWRSAEVRVPRTQDSPAPTLVPGARGVGGFTARGRTGYRIPQRSGPRQHLGADAPPTPKPSDPLPPSPTREAALHT